jgi:hypothetical protein
VTGAPGAAPAGVVPGAGVAVGVAVAVGVGVTMTGPTDSVVHAQSIVTDEPCTPLSRPRGSVSGSVSVSL